MAAQKGRVALKPVTNVEEFLEELSRHNLRRPVRLTLISPETERS